MKCKYCKEEMIKDYLKDKSSGWFFMSADEGEYQFICLCGLSGFEIYRECSVFKDGR